MAESKGLQYEVNKKLAEAYESIPIIGKKLNDLEIAVCDVTGDNFGTAPAGCEAKRDVVAKRGVCPQ